MNAMKKRVQLSDEQWPFVLEALLDSAGNTDDVELSQELMELLKQISEQLLDVP